MTQHDAKDTVDRRRTVPFLLKLYYKQGSFHRLDDFSTYASSLPHVEIYSWPSCTLRELAHLLTSALPSLLPDSIVGTRLAFRLVYPDLRDATGGGPPARGINNATGRYLTRELGSVVVSSEDGPGVSAPEAAATKKDSTASGDGHDDSNEREDGQANNASIVPNGPMSGKLAGEPELTLQEARFTIGDYISCAVLAPGRDGEAAPLLPPPEKMNLTDRGDREPAGFRTDRDKSYYGSGGSYRGHGNSGGGAGYRSHATGGFRSDPRHAPARQPDQDLLRSEWRRGERLPDGAERGFGRGRPSRGW